ncbi:hypothetical protein CCHR01_19217 [Colletotrichum chrysophilum]|uniref:Uncharacterized protein n=1 Tax=Colletotrichum chrysophilum TaxID=1836956 RepID=A0AAD9E801_9PEZI|nr:hypothetical protein CCHR01_19217 [Colletotrichum chrysophilum]
MSLARRLTAFGRIVQASGGDPSLSGLLAAIAGLGKEAPPCDDQARSFASRLLEHSVRQIVNATGR